MIVADVNLECREKWNFGNQGQHSGNANTTDASFNPTQSSAH